MPDRPVLLEPGEQELMRNLGGFAARRATNGVYLGTFYHTGLGAKVLVAVALGEQADAMHAILTSAAQPDETAILSTSGGKQFLDDGNGDGH